MQNDLTMPQASVSHPQEQGRWVRYLPWLVAMLPLGLTIYFARHLATIANGEALVATMPWVPSLGVEFSFYVDGLGVLMALLVSGIGTLVMLYSGTYLAGDQALPRFYLLITIFMLAMLGLVTAGNLITLFLFWELTSISSYMLIGYKHKSAEARNSALQALLITGGGGLALLAGLLMLGNAGGSFEIRELLTNAGEVQSHPHYVGILVLILLGAFTKSAQFPFHFWLPGAMSAPTPASAYLHSATMVKAGIYLLARLSPVVGGTDLWTSILVIAGTTTLLLGAWLAWQQSDLKRILAYSTVSALGTLVMLLGLGTEIAVKAALLFLIVHSLYKASLFLVAGGIDHATGTRDVVKLGGLARAMPWTATAAMLAALAMAGMAPFMGFISKELLYEATLGVPEWATALTAIAVIANSLGIVAAGLVAVQPFVGKPTAAGEHAHEGGWPLYIAPLLLAILGLLGAFFLTPVATLFLQPAINAIVTDAEPVKLYLWHGVNPMLILSIVTVVAGGIAFWGRTRLLTFVAKWPSGEHWGPARVYQIALDGLRSNSYKLTRVVQNGQLRRYVHMVLLTSFVLLAWGLWQSNEWQLPQLTTSIYLHEIVLAIVMLVAAYVATISRSRLFAVVSLGVVGLGVTIFFALFSAPDLAMTQFAIESLTVLLFMLVIYRLPRFTAFTSKSERFVDAVVAIGLGTLMATIVLLATSQIQNTALTTFVSESSLIEAHGRNVVNVILVDFRSFDTFGEIIVLSIASIGVYTLLTLRSNDPNPDSWADEDKADDSKEVRTAAPAANQERTTPGSLILRRSVMYLLPVLLLFSIFLLFRGHNEPGGGFVGGLVAASAFVLHAIVYNVKATRRLLGFSTRWLVIGGVALAAASGIFALILGQPFLTGTWSTLPVPIIGKIGTPFTFDVGVYSVVIGSTLTIFFRLMEPTEELD